VDRQYQVQQTVNIKTLPTWDSSTARDPVALRNRIAQLVALEHQPAAMIGFGRGGELYTGITSKYEITRWDKTGLQPQLLVTKAYKPRLRSEDEIAAEIDERVEQLKQEFGALAPIVTQSLMTQAFEMAKLPAVHDPLACLLVAADGSLLAVHPAEAGAVTADVFDVKGVFTNTVSLVGNPFMDSENKAHMVFQDNQAYGMVVNEDGENQVVRYTLKWQ